MGSKYQFRERGQDYSFENKNVFINHCQHKYQKSLHYSNPSEYYSYDFGETWNLISDFKSERQTIQNEKKPQNESRNHSTKSESKSGWGTYLIYVLSIWGGLSLINNKVTPIGFVNKINTELFGSNSNSTNKNNQEVIPSTQNNDETITEDNSSNENNTESSDNNSQIESNDNSSSNTYQEPERQPQPEKVKCYSCRGSGDCGECGKIFRVHTWEGYQGWKDRNETRLGYVMCSECSGAGVFYKRSDYPNVGKWEIEKKCYVGNCNSGWKPCNKCNGYGNGTLLGKCRDCKGSGYRN